MSIQKQFGKEAIPELLLKCDQAIKCHIYQGELAVMPDVEKKIRERIELWSSGEHGLEWGGVGTGKVLVNGDEDLPLITDFYELPAFNLNRHQSYTICLDDIAKIGEKNLILALLHSHPSGNLFPSSSDLATFLYTDILLGRPILYIIASPNGEKLILSFAKCWECENSFLKIIQGVREQHGGEKFRWEAST